VAEVIGRGEEKMSFRLEGGLQVDLRFFEPSAFGAALHYFTGCKAHNIALRRRAQEKGWKLNEYGLFTGGRRLAGKTEEAVYSRLGLPWIAPELREDRGELEAAEEGRLPDLVEEKRLRGDLHCHTDRTDGRNTIEEMAAAARARGYDYLAVTDHSQAVSVANGLDDDGMREHAERIRSADEELDDLWLLAGVEVDILEKGRLDLSEEVLADLDWVVASIHYHLNQGRERITDRLLAAVESGVVHALGHPTARMIGSREPLDFDHDRVFAACAEHGVCLEINCQSKRLDLPDTLCRRAKEAGAKVAIGTDAHHRGALPTIRQGLTVARRGWLEREDVLNTRTAKQLRKHLADR
jgi:DNA polymerase (family 10)